MTLVLIRDLADDGEANVYSIMRVGPPELFEEGLTDPTIRLRELGASDPADAIAKATANGLATISEESDYAAEAPISAADLAKKIEALHNWSSPGQLTTLVDELSRAVGRKDFRSNPFKPVREGWVIADFATRTNADAARLPSQTTGAPDGELRYGEKLVRVEVTEAIESWRRPHAERPGTAESDTLEQWEARFREIQPQLGDRILGKAKKPYASSTTLLVYLNINEYDIRNEQALAQIQNLISQHRARFEGLKVLWKDRWY